MVDTVIDGFSAAATLTGTEEFIAVQSAAAVNPTATQIQTLAHKFPIEAMPSAPASGLELLAQLRGGVNLMMRTPNAIRRIDFDWSTGYEFFLSPGATTSITNSGGNVTTTGTISAPAITGALGRRANFVSGTGGGVAIGASSAATSYMHGDGVGPYRGYSISSVLSFPDASYNNTGAATGKRIFVGVTDQTMTVLGLADDPPGNHAGFFRCHVNGGLTHTNWQFMTKNAPTINIVDTGLVFTPGSVVEFSIFSPPGTNETFWSIRDITTGSAVFSGSTSTLTPSGSALLRAGFQLGVVEGLAVNIAMTSFRARGLLNQV